MASSKGKTGKTLSSQAVTGEAGIAYIHRIVTAMGCGWHPTNQTVEVGIDGEIELVNPKTREATNAIIRVQSRATILRFTAETDTGFEYICEERELDYWMSGNAPVILVRSRPHSDEAYWVSIKDYFADARVRKTRKIVFEKRAMRFDKNALPALFDIAMPKSKGLYFAPAPREEKLYTNLLEVSRMPNRLWLAETHLRTRREVFNSLLASGSDLPEFAISYKRVLSAHDLSQPAWATIVDPGTVEEFPSSEWADSPDIDKRNLFTELLTYCLGARARSLDVVFWRADGETQLWFEPTGDLAPREVPYRSVKETAERIVFRGFPYTSGARMGEIAYYRHLACQVRFRRYDGQWLLELNPTYHFTTDGKFPHPRSERYLSGIKRLERQGAVMYQVVCWAAVLRGSVEGEDPYFANQYPFIGFGPLRTFDLKCGIDEKAWLSNEEASVTQVGEQTLEDLPLFEDINPYSDAD
jgi:hypothetical protein